MSLARTLNDTLFRTTLHAVARWLCLLASILVAAITPAFADDGGFRLYVDGELRGEVLDLPNGTRDIDSVKIGAWAGIDPPTQGTYRLDLLRLRPNFDSELVDGFESGDLSAWPAVANSGNDLVVGSVSPLDGSFDLAVEVDGSDPRAAYVGHTQLGELGSLGLHFLLDPGDLYIQDGQRHVLVIGLDSAYDRNLYLFIGADATHGLHIQLAARRDSGSYVYSSKVSLEPRVQEVAIDWWRSGTSAPPSLSADFTAACNTLACDFDASPSTASAGIASYQWDFGDGSTATGSSASHAYAGPASPTVTLTVVDQTGNAAQARRLLDIEDAGPVARFFWGCRGALCTFDASEASDDLGLAGYAWDFGDGTSGEGELVEHVYSSAGPHTVRLTVTDTSGHTNGTSLTVDPDGDRDTVRLLIDDETPLHSAGLQIYEGWNWSAFSPGPVSGAFFHVSPDTAGKHQHLAYRGRERLWLRENDTLFTWIYLDSASLPRSIVLQFLEEDALWHHRAYWGENLHDKGVDGSGSLRRLGDIPEADRWVKLEVPAELVGLAGERLDGVAYTLYDGTALWDATGVEWGVVEPLALPGSEPTVATEDNGPAHPAGLWGRFFEAPYDPDRSYLLAEHETGDRWRVDVGDGESIVDTAHLTGVETLGPNLYDVADADVSANGYSSADARLGLGYLVGSTGESEFVTFRLDTVVDATTGATTTQLVIFAYHPDRSSALVETQLVADLATAELTAPDGGPGIDPKRVPVLSDSYCASAGGAGAQLCSCFDEAKSDYNWGLAFLLGETVLVGASCVGTVGFTCLAGSGAVIYGTLTNRADFMDDLEVCWGTFVRSSCNRTGEYCRQTLGVSVLVRGLDGFEESVQISGSCSNPLNFTQQAGPTRWFGGMYDNFLECPVPWELEWYPQYSVQVDGYEGPNGWQKTCTSANAGGSLNSNQVVIFDCRCTSSDGCESRDAEISASLSNLDSVVSVTAEGPLSGGLWLVTRNGSESMTVPSGDTYSLTIQSDPPGYLCRFSDTNLPTLTRTSQGTDQVHGIFCQRDPSQETPEGPGGDDDGGDGPADDRRDPNHNECHFCQQRPSPSPCYYETTIVTTIFGDGDDVSRTVRRVLVCPKNNRTYRSPELTVASPRPGAAVEGEILLEAEAFDASGVAEYRVWIGDQAMPIDDGLIDPITGRVFGRVDLTGVPAGVYDFQVSVIDHDPTLPLVVSARQQIHVTKLTTVPAPPGEPDILVSIETQALPDGGIYRFVDTPPGDASEVTLRILNGGDAALEIWNPTQLVSGECFDQVGFAPPAIAAGQSAEVGLRFRCYSEGLATGTLQIQSSDPNTPSFDLALEGTIVTPPAQPAPDLAVSWVDGAVVDGASLAYPTTELSVPVSREFTVTNLGDADLVLTQPWALVSGVCYSQLTDPSPVIAPGGSSTFRVKLQCPSAGTYTGIIEIATNDPDEGAFAFSITGTVVDPARPEIAIYRDWEAVEQTDGSTFVFPQTPAGTPVSRRFRVENLGDGALDIASAQVAGTCWSLIETPASSVAPGGSTHFRVRLLCNTAGTYPGSVTLVNNDDDEASYEINLTGTVN